MEEKKKVLKNIYDVINKIARVHKAKGEDVSDWFYTKTEVQRFKKTSTKKFI